MMKLFISYSRTDKIWVHELFHGLQNQGHHSVWMDTKLEAGERFWKRILEEIKACDCVLFIQTPRSVRSDYCQAEIKYALAINKPVIAVMREPSAFALLDEFQTLDASNENNMAMVLLQIQMGLNLLRKEDYPEKEAPLPKAPQSSMSRWRGLPISDFMIRPEKLVCIRKDTSLSEAVDILDNVGYRFRHLLITETGKAKSPLLGIVSLRDMHKQMYGGLVEDISTICVEEFMTPFTTTMYPEPMFMTIHQNDNLETAIEKFLVRLSRGHAVGRFYYMSAIPVVDDDNNAISIVSFKDILAMVNKGVIPLGETTVKEYYRPYSKIVVVSAEQSPRDARLKLGRIGQRDVPIVDKDARLLGLVPDHILLQNLATGKSLGDIFVPVAELKLQTLTTSLTKMLNEYLPTDLFKTYYSFAVVDERKKEKPELLGMIGYLDLFRAILDNE